MDRAFALAALLAVAVPVHAADHTLVVLAEHGEAFSLYIDGKLVNSEPASRVTVGGIRTDAVQIRVVFSDSEFKADVQTGKFTGDAAAAVDYRTTYGVGTDERGRYRLTRLSAVARR